MLPRLVLFDIDGTLTRGAGPSDGLFARAVEAELSVRMHQRWAEYRYSTDSGILEQVVIEALGRSPHEAEVRRVQGRYHAELRREAGCLQPTAGASGALAHLGASAGTTVAIATGNWREAGRIKLRGAGVEAEGLRIFSASDAISRPQILRCALEAHGVRPEQAVYVGDAPWDALAAQELGLPFVGLVDERNRFSEIEDVVTLTDFTRIEQIEAALEIARPPRARDR